MNAEEWQAVNDPVAGKKIVAQQSLFGEYRQRTTRVFGLFELQRV